MSENKRVNRVFLITILLYVGTSLGLSLAAPYVPALAGMSSYVSILLSQALIFLPGFLYCKSVATQNQASSGPDGHPTVEAEGLHSKKKGTKVRDFLPYRKINIATIVLVIVCTYLMYPLIIVLNAISMIFTTTGSEAVMDLMQGQSFV